MPRRSTVSSEVVQVSSRRVDLMCSLLYMTPAFAPSDRRLGFESLLIILYFPVRLVLLLCALSSSSMVLFGCLGAGGGVAAGMKHKRAPLPSTKDMQSSSSTVCRRLQGSNHEGGRKLDIGKCVYLHHTEDAV